MKHIIITYLTFLTISASAQKVYVEIGKSITTFDYKTTGGEVLDNLTGSNTNRISLGTRIPLFKTDLHFAFEALYHEYAAQGSNPILGNFYSWDFVNTGANIGFDYEFLKPSVSFNTQQGFSFVLKAVVAGEFLVMGTQNINNQINSLKDAPEFDRPFIFARGGLGVNYYFDPQHIISINYSLGKSFLIGDYTNQERLSLFSHSFSLGLSVNLAPDKTNVR
jgi:hypothetical protein